MNITAETARELQRARRRFVEAETRLRTSDEEEQAIQAAAEEYQLATYDLSECAEAIGAPDAQ